MTGAGSGRVVLATLCHDPRERLVARIRELLPLVWDHVDGVAVCVSQATARAVVDVLERGGATTRPESVPCRGIRGIGRARREAVALAQTLSPSWIVYSDIDHVLRWARDDPDGFASVLDTVRRHDFTVVGRSREALAELPGTLRETETLVNRVFERLTGHEWDLMSGVRGMSRDAADAIVSGCMEDSIANDTAWPMHVLRDGRFSVCYVEGGGLRYEDTEQFADPGDVDVWRHRLETDPHQWTFRLEVARLMVEAMAPYLECRER